MGCIGRWHDMVNVNSNNKCVLVGVFALLAVPAPAPALGSLSCFRVDPMRLSPQHYPSPVRQQSRLEEIIFECHNSNGLEKKHWASM
jgi:hypothetical protein